MIRYSTDTPMLRRIWAEPGTQCRLEPFVDAYFFQRDRTLSFSALDRHGATPLVGHKIFQCPKQIRAKASLFPADSGQALVLYQICKKSLGNILCFLGGSTLSLHEAVNRSPINAAEVFERFLCRGRFTLRLYDDAPVRAGKLRRPFLYAGTGMICGKLVKVHRLNELVL